MRGLFQLRAPRPPSRKASFVDSFGSHEGFTFGSGEVSRSSDDYVIILISKVVLAREKVVQKLKQRMPLHVTLLQNDRGARHEERKWREG